MNAIHLTRNPQSLKNGDFYIYHNGRKVKRLKLKTVKTASRYFREETHYYYSECDGCPYRDRESDMEMEIESAIELQKDLEYFNEGR